MNMTLTIEIEIPRRISSRRNSRLHMEPLVVGLNRLALCTIHRLKTKRQPLLRKQTTKSRALRRKQMAMMRPRVTCPPTQLQNIIGHPSRPLLTFFLTDSAWVDRFLALLAGSSPPARIRSAVRTLRVSPTLHFTPHTDRSPPLRSATAATYLRRP